MSDVPNLPSLLEATLFGAGRSIPQNELAEMFQITESTMRMALLDLQATIEGREECPIQLTEINRYWVLEVKPHLAKHLPQIARTEIPKKLLKIAALVAYQQPMQQNRLVEMVGQVAYEHVSDLRELGLIDKRRDGNTRRLTTTRRFSEYFGCPHTATADVAAWFKEQASGLGLTGSQLADALSRGGEESGPIDSDDSMGHDSEETSAEREVLENATAINGEEE
ncbi:MAG: SMC-Scp complex subunit ScpB [Euryarchaeota archaeon]|nr:SMC-Scp complex subunit ScpB [Euryarchaeota archaeon]